MWKLRPWLLLLSDHQFLFVGLSSWGMIGVDAATVEKKTPMSSAGRRLRVAILYQAPEGWCNVRSVWAALSRDEAVDARVVLLPFLHQDYEWNRGRAESYLSDQGVPFVPWDAFDLVGAGLDVVIYTSPYDQTRPREYHFAELRRHVCYVAYVPYALDVGGGPVNVEFQFGQPVTKHADAIFVRSEGARHMFERYCPSGAAHVVVSGHPRMDAIANLRDFQVDPAMLEAIGDRRAVLWNAHFSFDSDQWSTFDRLAESIFEAFRARPGLALLFRPHPLLWKKLVNLGILAAGEIDGFKRELRSLGVVVDEHEDHRHAFAASTAMISDASSFLLEYLVVGRPVLYLENRYGFGLNEEGMALVPNYQVAQTGAEIGAFLDQLLRGEDPLKARRAAAVEAFFPGFDGMAGQRVVEHLKARAFR